ncbi:MAG: hypothetical protein WBH20_03475 [Oceanisphaera sp.]|uniref:hypothetical protein n=1 Tax=Oceanisphaera sp. TaxID=1929979 RepID=UPI003C734396
MSEVLEAEAQARKWRSEWGYTGRGGLVLVCGGKVQNWCDRLPDAAQCIKGCIALDEGGKAWGVVVGTALDGSFTWLSLGGNDEF